MANDDRFDVVIVGGGPAGLSAALVLGRCRRRVVLVDAGRPRNRRARAAHGFFTRDGEQPCELIRIGRRQLEPYDVVLVDDEVTNVARGGDGFAWHARTRGGRTLEGKKLLLATGMRDRMPDIPGIRGLLGASVHVCPYCDGWEVRDQPLAAYACDPGAADFALGLLTWSEDVVLFTDGRPLSPDDRRRLERNGVGVHDERIEALERDGDRLVAVRLEGGGRVARTSMFVHLGQDQASPFALELGCPTIPNGSVITNDHERSGPDGLYVAGDASHDLQLVAVAVAEGVRAACAINTELRVDAHR